MKIGIITKIGKNYGAVLQAYALKKILCNMGNDAHVIRYTPRNCIKSYRVCKFPWGRTGAKANLKAILHFRGYKESSSKFDEFKEAEFNFIGNYSNDKEIEANPPQCDIFISGSDQVWNPINSFDRAYYCGFVKKSPMVITASYAASIGLKKIPEKFSSEFESRVKKFDYISVREKQALSILSDMNIRADLAPDPTLLLSKEDWHTMARKTIEEPYILCYFVSVPKGIQNIVNEFKKKLGLKVVNLMLSEESSCVGDIKVRNAGPREFVGLFENASFVITSSFHGTVFSLINSKPFVVTLYNSTSSRVTELLENFECTDRIISPDCKDVLPYLKFDYNKETREQIFSVLRNRGIDILKKIEDLH